jgi:hypothetical protein
MGVFGITVTPTAEMTSQHCLYHFESIHIRINNGALKKKACRAQEEMCFTLFYFMDE